MGSSRAAIGKMFYAAKAETAVSWYQRHPVRSLQMIVAAAPDRAAPVIDIGGGASTLIDDLLAEGFGDRHRSRCSGGRTREIESAARIGEEQGVVDRRRHHAMESAAALSEVWHDRAVFHFRPIPRRQ